ncbi:protein traS, partial [Salmonella enterica subsp. enterica serovar Richmond]|nr:protein traS [Salmonella enterica subsp. enterica serovar Richmond]
MKITRSMIEQDAQYLLESVRATDYEIPSSGDIFKVIFKVYVFVVLLQIIGVLFDWLI